MEALSIIPDPRIQRRQKFSLLEVLITAVCCVLCGAETWNEIAEEAEFMTDWFRSALGLELGHGTPSHDTYRRVFSLIDPAAFQKAFIQWVNAIRELIPGEVVAVDGKTLRRAMENGKEKSEIHLINAWASESGLVLGQMKSEGKGNEILTVPKFLEQLRVRGCIVTSDAMNCQKETAQKVVEKGADYVLAVKGNQEGLNEQIAKSFAAAEEKRFRRVENTRFETQESGHGRQEARSYLSLSKAQARKLHRLDIGNEWPKLNSVTRVVSTRTVNASTTRATRYFISSLPANAEKISHAIRTHWQVENNVHWVLDLGFREDESRMRKENSPVNFSMIRKLALNLLRQETSKKGRSLRLKRKRCSWSGDYLLKVLLIQPLNSI